ncbi:hypothetical protein SMICM17S_12134 [Streptomyces microflavus]
MLVLGAVAGHVADLAERVVEAVVLGEDGEFAVVAVPPVGALLDGAGDEAAADAGTQYAKRTGSAEGGVDMRFSRRAGHGEVAPAWPRPPPRRPVPAPGNVTARATLQVQFRDTGGGGRVPDHVPRVEERARLHCPYFGGALRQQGAAARDDLDEVLDVGGGRFRERGAHHLADVQTLEPDARLDQGDGVAAPLGPQFDQRPVEVVEQPVHQGVGVAGGQGPVEGQSDVRGEGEERGEVEGDADAPVGEAGEFGGGQPVEVEEGVTGQLGADRADDALHQVEVAVAVLEPDDPGRPGEGDNHLLGGEDRVVALVDDRSPGRWPPRAPRSGSAALPGRRRRGTGAWRGARPPPASSAVRAYWTARAVPYPAPATTGTCPAVSSTAAATTRRNSSRVSAWNSPVPQQAKTAAAPESIPARTWAREQVEVDGAVGSVGRHGEEEQPGNFAEPGGEGAEVAGAP